MLIVGAPLFESFWQGHPAAEPHLRALYALLARTPADRIGEALAGAERENGGQVRLTLATAVVTMRLGPNGIVRIESVETPQ